MRGGGLLTTNHVIGETWTFLRRRLGHPEARTFVERAERSARLLIIHVGGGRGRCLGLAAPPR